MYKHKEVKIGTVDIVPQGLIISSGSVLPTFDLLVDSIRFTDNGTQTIDPSETDHRQLIGFEKSSSLANVKLSIPQFDFYKGATETKGTANQ